MSSSEVITEGVPEGWLVKIEWVPEGQDLRPFYRAYRWYRKEKVLFRKMIQLHASGWKRTTLVERHLGDTITLIKATIQAESPRK